MAAGGAEANVSRGVSQAAACTLTVLICSALSSVPCQAARSAEPGNSAVPAAAGPKLVDRMLALATGDLDGMIERRTIRALVVPNRIGYFLDDRQQRGAAYEALAEFERVLNRRLGRRTLRVHVVIIPVSRDQLVPALVAGRGDIAAANLTITPGRRSVVDFTVPWIESVREVVITGPGEPPVRSVEDLAGRTLYVRASSSYRESLEAINHALRPPWLPVTVEYVDEVLETDDILELVSAGIFPLTVADDYLARIWTQFFPGLQLQPLALREQGEIAWAVRKDSPRLRQELDTFIRTRKQGTLFGNVLIKRYMEGEQPLRNARAAESTERLRSMTEVFKRYGARYGFDWLMLAAQAYQESGLDQSVRSRRGAVGVMQILPSTARNPPVGIRDISNVENNIHAGVKYLHAMRERYFADEGIADVDRLLFSFAAYNSGPTRITRLREQAGSEGLDPDVWFDNVEIVAAKRIGRETVSYVRNIYKYYVSFKLLERQGELRRQARERLLREE